MEGSRTEYGVNDKTAPDQDPFHLQPKKCHLEEQVAALLLIGLRPAQGANQKQHDENQQGNLDAMLGDMMRTPSMRPGPSLWCRSPRGASALFASASVFPPHIM
ncbi:hypothetical protein G113_07433 [Aeromonas molluscorum 848]|uniref:Uncharacterized protein n=1 Tax=Aeromonas molluscorum 848 TaxID=1268236 RepID=R1HBB7_9GAMM|nr:hypothetical protein G113_07433 [Aeromonas molluscorum 848]